MRRLAATARDLRWPRRPGRDPSPAASPCADPSPAALLCDSLWICLPVCGPSGCRPAAGCGWVGASWGGGVGQTVGLGGASVGGTMGGVAGVSVGGRVGVSVASIPWATGAGGAGAGGFNDWDHEKNQFTIIAPDFATWFGNGYLTPYLK
jgi:hypothetical protein